MKKILSILLIGILTITLTGCGAEKGDSRFDYIIKQMNIAVDESIERNNGVSVVTLEERFMQNLSSARMIACGDKPFTKGVDVTKTSYTRNLDGYDGSIAYSSTVLTKDANINYCMVLATNARGYLNVKVTYENNKPVFSVPVVINGD